MVTKFLEATSGQKGRLLLWALWLAIAVALFKFRHAVLPFAIAVVIAYLLEPLVRRLCGLRLKGWSPPRWLAVVALYLVFIGGLYGFLVAVVPALYKEVAGLSRAGARFFNSVTPQRIAELSGQVEGWLASRGIPVELTGSEPGEGVAFGLTFDLETSLREGLAQASGVLRAHFLDALGVARRLLGGVVGFLFKFFFVMMVAAFLLIDWARIGAFFRTLVPAERQSDFAELMAAIDAKLSGVVRGQAMICVVNGVLTAVGLVVLGVPFVFVLSLVATVMSAIPIFGSILSSIPIVLIGLTKGLETGVGILAWIIGIHALEAYVLNPKILGTHAHIHPVVVAFALLAGEATYGFTGALFAVPVAGILAAIFTCMHERALRRMEPAAEVRGEPVEGKLEA